jgi:ABC-type phosphate/phosphonate transport system substrate-binding protein
MKQQQTVSGQYLFSARLVVSVLLGVILLAACASPDSAETVVTVVVTSQAEREVEITRDVVVTVQVPVEITRQIFIPVTETPVPIGSDARPIRLLFAPAAEPSTIVSRASRIESYLEDTLGLAFQAITPLTYNEFFTAACDHSAETVAFMPALAYPYVNEQCDLQAQFTGLRDGLPWSASMIVVRSEGDVLEELVDLEERVWGVSDSAELANSLYFQARFAEEGIEPGAVKQFGADAVALVAFAEDEEDLDFVTARYVPPILPFDERQWQFGEDDPEIWREVSNFPRRSGIGFVVVSGYVENGGYRVRDARSAVLDTADRIFIDTTILDLSAQIPNAAIAFDANMPLGLATQIGDALIGLADSAECPQSLCAGDFYAWEGITATTDGAYEPVRYVIEQLELDEEAISGYLEAAR